MAALGICSLVILHLQAGGVRCEVSPLQRIQGSYGVLPPTIAP